MKVETVLVKAYVKALTASGVRAIPIQAGASCDATYLVAAEPGNPP